MTDDFRLFGDDDDCGSPMDADVALITAYLARELSPMQVLAVEERLVSDTEFRATMQPLIDAWAAPVGSLAGSAIRSPQLTAEEKAACWDRLQGLEPDATTAAADTRRRIPMKRVAAIVGLTALPVLSFAQAVTYAARHENAPGHAVAAWLVAAFTPQAAAVDSPSAPTVIQDVPMATVLTPPVANIDRAPVPVAELLPVSSNPDRARVAALVKQHQPNVVHGGTAVEYVVIVVDASDKYLWSTIGNGNLLIEVGADSRSPNERIAYNLQFFREFTGNEFSLSTKSMADTVAKATRKPPYAIAKLDSTGKVAVGSPTSAGVVARKVQDTVMYEGGVPYRTGWNWPIYSTLNAAAGLQEPGRGESGIQGIRSASVALADAYTFDKGELAPQLLRVVMVKLTPATNWRRGY